MTIKVEFYYQTLHENYSYEGETFEEICRSIISDGHLDASGIVDLEISRIASPEELSEFMATFVANIENGAELREARLLEEDRRKLARARDHAVNYFRSEIPYCNAEGVQRARKRAFDTFRASCRDLQSSAKLEELATFEKALEVQINDFTPRS